MSVEDRDKLNNPFSDSLNNIWERHVKNLGEIPKYIK